MVFDYVSKIDRKELYGLMLENIITSVFHKHELKNIFCINQTTISKQYYKKNCDN